MTREQKKEFAKEIFFTTIYLAEMKQKIEYGEVNETMMRNFERYTGRLWGIIDTVTWIDKKFAEHLRKLHEFVERRLQIRRTVTLFGKIIDKD